MGEPLNFAQDPAAIASSVLWLLTYVIFPVWMAIHALSRKQTSFFARVLSLGLIVILHPYGAYLYGLFATGSKIIVIVSIVMFLFSGMQALKIRNMQEENPEEARIAYEEMTPALIRKMGVIIDDYRQQDVGLVEYIKRSGIDVRTKGFFKYFQNDENAAKRDWGSEDRKEGWWKKFAVSREAQRQTDRRERSRPEAVKGQNVSAARGFRVAVRPEDLSGLKMREGGLVEAVQIGDLQRVDRLLTTGADKNVRSAMGTTPLMEAAQLGYREIVELLLNAGADPAVRTPEGETAASLARKSFRQDIAERLESLEDNGSASGAD